MYANRTAITRRSFCEKAAFALGGAGLAPQLSTTFGANAKAAVSEPSMKAQAAKAGIVFGTAVTHSYLSGPAFIEVLRHDVACVAPEVELCPGRVITSTGSYDFTQADAMVLKLRELGFEIYGHHILWQDYLPAYLKGLPPKAVPDFFKRHISEMIDHYKETISTWNLVNEPCYYWKPNTNGLRQGPYLSAFGEDYISKAFEIAKQTSPGKLYVLNEAFTERADIGPFFRNRLLAVIDKIQAAGLHIGAIGLQGHLRPQFGFDYSNYAKFLNELERRNLDIFITELDVEDITFPDEITARDKEVALVYQQFLSVALASPKVKRVNIWNLVDTQSFYNHPPQRTLARESRPLIYDGQLHRKPAWYAMYDAFGQASGR